MVERWCKSLTFFLCSKLPDITTVAIPDYQQQVVNLIRVTCDSIVVCLTSATQATYLLLDYQKSELTYHAWSSADKTIEMHDVRHSYYFKGECTINLDSSLVILFHSSVPFEAPFWPPFHSLIKDSHAESVFFRSHKCSSYRMNAKESQNPLSLWSLFQHSPRIHVARHQQFSFSMILTPM